MQLYNDGLNPGTAGSIGLKVCARTCPMQGMHRRLWSCQHLCQVPGPCNCNHEAQPLPTLAVATGTHAYCTQGIADSLLLQLPLRKPRKKISVMIVGNHSAGKSSFINWYIGESIQKTVSGAVAAAVARDLRFRSTNFSGM